MVSCPDPGLAADTLPAPTTTALSATSATIPRFMATSLPLPLTPTNAQLVPRLGAGAAHSGRLYDRAAMRWGTLLGTIVALLLPAAASARVIEAGSVLPPGQSGFVS